MFFSDDFFSALWPHKLKFLPSLLLIKRVDKQIQIVNLLHFVHEFRNVSHEFGWIHVINKVDVNFVLS